MPLPLLISTACAVWKDEATKLKVLEGGPYFFSRRFLVLRNWKRMMSLSTHHPSIIPTWIKIHQLPLECWTTESISRIASTIGKPLYVDKATEMRQRLDFSRICVEIDAGTELPDEIQITVNGFSVVVALEYQWLPFVCFECKVFGHGSNTCRKNRTTINPNKKTTGRLLAKVKQRLALIMIPHQVL